MTVRISKKRFPGATFGRPVGSPDDESELERELRKQIGMMGLNLPAFVQFYRFDPIRRWKLDFADLERKVGIEVDGSGPGGVGGHGTEKGRGRDAEKANAAVLQGWRILRATGPMIRDWTFVRWLVTFYQALRSGEDEAGANGARAVADGNSGAIPDPGHKRRQRVVQKSDRGRGSIAPRL
jgi:very-short-patch-repair endonuclease